ncbi:MAG: hypothetical protein HKN47_22530 [Pirellulaceae bacterium]|nr:hypothetical protein [Pirellulaceae bacterium]
MCLFVSLWVATLIRPTITLADGPDDNLADNVRPIPPVGLEIDADIIASLTQKCKAVRSRWQEVIDTAHSAKSNSRQQRADKDAAIERLTGLEPEILVFPRAVEMAIEFQQFYKPNEIDSAGQLLQTALHRIKIANRGGDWADVIGLGDGRSQQLIVGGYRSKIDGSFQPYSAVVPAGYTKGDRRPRRLDLWFHGRGETLSEVNFLFNQQRNSGQYTPDDTFVLHPYGRYSNAFKFAGEIDVLESLQYVQSRLPLDSTRISVRGFSMGGAGCWQMAVHYADRFFAANPGAGFSETPEFLSFFQGENASETAPPHQKILWQLYDCPPWAANLNQCPTVAYSGQIDRQKQAADVMQVALANVGIDMTHIIGPETAHKIHPQSKIDIESRMNALARAASDNVPETIHFRTMTLRYHKMHWIDVRGLGQHWVPAAVDARVDDGEIEIETENVTHLRLSFDAGQFPESSSGPVHILIDSDEIVGPNVRSDRSFELDLVKQQHTWQQASQPTSELRKQPYLQGPIDDAFMDSFIFVLPSGRSHDAAVQKWVHAESKHAMEHWRKHFRGDIRQILDTQLTDDMVRSSNLVLFGDQSSNAVIDRLIDSLPVRWNQNEIAIGDAKVNAAGHLPILIYPNPENPHRYIVMNSGFTFREYDYLNNARQTPKLPDWALVDIRDGSTMRDPGKVTAAGFFDETWQPSNRQP